jgi:hypothetical protein
MGELSSEIANIFGQLYQLSKKGESCESINLGSVIGSTVGGGIAGLVKGYFVNLFIPEIGEGLAYFYGLLVASPASFAFPLAGGAWGEYLWK